MIRSAGGGGRWTPAQRLVVLSACLVAALTMSCNAKPAVSRPSGQAGAAATPGGTPKPATLTFSIFGPTWNTIERLVAQKKGFFAAENLTVDEVVAGGAAPICQQVTARAADVGECSVDVMVQAVESGAPLESVDVKSAAIQLSVLARPSISTWSELKGKTVMVGGPKDASVYEFHVMARANGLKDSDYDFQYTGSSANRYLALKTGAVDAAMIASPFAEQAEAAGYHRLGNLLPQYLDASSYIGGNLVVRRDWAEAHPDELVRFIRAHFRAIDWLYDPANKDELYDIVKDYLHLNREDFDQLYQSSIVTDKFWFRDGRIQESAMQGVLKALADVGNLKEPLPPATKYYDNTYVNQALTSLGR
jgi:ABC-type nitrate/sulfonate/bicarbonate transport system substrate-binding protein